MREADDEALPVMTAVRRERKPFSIDLLYSDQVGGQRTISRFSLVPVGDEAWLTTTGLHWYLDRDGPR